MMDLNYSAFILAAKANDNPHRRQEAYFNHSREIDLKQRESDFSRIASIGGRPLGCIHAS